MTRALIILIIVPLNVYAQFAGKVVYQDSYVSKNPNIPSIALEKFIGSKRELYIQGAFYKTVHYGELKSIIIYRGDENKAYRFKEGADTILVMDASLDTLSTESHPLIEDSDEVILGLKCKKLTVTSVLGTTTYYFNKAYPLNPSDFTNHRLEHWNLYTATAKAIPLKIVFEGKQIGFTSTAVKVEVEKLPSDIFKIPSGYLKKLF